MAREQTIEDLEFDLLLKDKRHKELIDVLKAILKNLDTFNKESTKTIMESLLLKTSELPSSIQSIASVIVAKLEEINNTKKEWVFDIERNSYGYITTITAKHK